MQVEKNPQTIEGGWIRCIYPFISFHKLFVNLFCAGLCVRSKRMKHHGVPRLEEEAVVNLDKPMYKGQWAGRGEGREDELCHKGPRGAL